MIGAGAAGLVASWRSASRGLSTLVLEKNKKLGVKILMSGGTRCNVTHHTDRRGIIDAFGHQGKFLHSALARFGPDDVVRTLSGCGVETKVESTGKIFPVSNRAIDVRDAFVHLSREAGAIIENPVAASQLEWNAGQFRVATDRETYAARHVIVCVGGKSYPGCGTTGDGFAWATQFGHTIEQPVPSLAPIVTGDRWPRELSGITIADCHVAVTDADQTVLGSSRGSLLLTHFGFSGPAAMNVSRFIDLHANIKTMLSVDFYPERNREQLRNDLWQFRDEYSNQPIARLLVEKLPKRLVEQLLIQTDIAPARPCAELSKTQINQLVNHLKQFEFSISGTRGFAKAEVTAGGVRLTEIDSSTMESKLQRGLYFAGEILDLDGPIGGFNFQSAFSTGYLAGESVPLTSS